MSTSGESSGDSPGKAPGDAPGETPGEASGEDSAEASSSPAGEKAPRGQALVPDPALTIDQGRLAGSPRCLNCGTALEGPFCHYCGQPDRNFMRFFPALLREFLSEFLELDSRFSRTMRPLLFQPGRLTRDYLDGRRFRYTPPLRLYLFSSIVFFLLAAFLSSDAIESNVTASTGIQGIKITAETEEDLDELKSALADLPPALRERLEAELDDATVTSREREEFFETQEINLDGEPWHPENNPVDITWAPQGINDWINREIGNSPEKVKRINEDPGIIVRELFDILPAAMFVLLPVVALIFKFWYLFAGRYYIEHLILALHNHSFVFVSLIVLLFFDLVEEYGLANDIGWLNQLGLWSGVVVLCWVPLYLVWSLKTVYRQGWFMTVLKGFLIGFSYLMLLVFVSTAVAVLSFILV